MAESQWVVEVTMHNFQEVVVEGSRQRPVVIDFWAEWCGPCRRLAPVLEKVAAEKAGAFVLAKVNTDENPELAQAFQIEGIPAVFAIRDGKVAGHFTGVIPEEEFLQFLDQIGAGAPVAPAEPSPLDRARELEATDPKGAADVYRAMLAAAPSDPAARVGLARFLLATPGAEAEASALLTGVEFGDFEQEAKGLRTVVELRAVPHSDSDLAAAKANATAEGKLRLAQVLAARGEYPAAFDALLEAAGEDQQLGRGPVRELMLKLFDVPGVSAEAAGDYRRRLQGLLY